MVTGYQDSRFTKMIPNCLEYARQAHSEGKPIVGILCEYTPRELILAAGAVPVCLCGGSQKTIPIAEEVLPTNLCPLIKSTFGYHRQKSNPFLEMASLIVAENTCDGKKKMYEIMAQSRPLHILDMPQKQDHEAALDYWTLELRQLKEELERRFQVEITDDAIREASTRMNRERRLRRQLAEVQQMDSPPLTGAELLTFRSSISGIEEDLTEYERLYQSLNKADTNPEMSSRVRVLLTGVPIVHGAERVLNLIEEQGGVVVCMESCTGLRPILEDVDTENEDILRALAEKYYHLPCSVLTPNQARMDMMRGLINDYRPQCIIELVWQACLTYDVESYGIQQFAENEAGLPYLKIETDYSPSDSARIALRVQALYETIRGV